MGAGKSTVGRIVAARLGRVHIDTDEEVERIAGSSVSAIFSAHGEAWFRAEESRVVASVLAGAVPAVISVGGGAVLDPVTRLALRARPETLARRVGGTGDRPLLAAEAGGPAAEGPTAVLARLEAERRPMYEEVASTVIDVDGLTPEAVVDWVVAGVAGGPDEVRR